MASGPADADEFILPIDRPAKRRRTSSFFSLGDEYPALADDQQHANLCPMDGPEQFEGRDSANMDWALGGFSAPPFPSPPLNPLQGHSTPPFIPTPTPPGPRVLEDWEHPIPDVLPTPSVPVCRALLPPSALPVQPDLHEAVRSFDKYNRLIWTPFLHDRFLEAVSLFTIDKARPKGIKQAMRVRGITLEHIKSHLQKYRACVDTAWKQKSTLGVTMKLARVLDNEELDRYLRSEAFGDRPPNFPFSISPLVAHRSQFQQRLRPAPAPVAEQGASGEDGPGPVDSQPARAAFAHGAPQQTDVVDSPSTSPPRSASSVCSASSVSMTTSSSQGNLAASAHAQALPPRAHDGDLVQPSHAPDQHQQQQQQQPPVDQRAPDGGDWDGRPPCTPNNNGWHHQQQQQQHQPRSRSPPASSQAPQSPLYPALEPPPAAPPAIAPPSQPPSPPQPVERATTPKAQGRMARHQPAQTPGEVVSKMTTAVTHLQGTVARLHEVMQMLGRALESGTNQ